VILAKGAVVLVRVADGKLAQDINEHLWSVRDVAFSPSRPLLASWSSDKTVLWGVEDAGQTPKLAPLQRLGGASCGAFTPDGSLPALGSETEISLVSGMDAKVVRKLALKPTGEPVSIAFSADGRTLAA